MNTIKMNNGAVVLASSNGRPRMFERAEAEAEALKAGPGWGLEVMRTAPRYYVVLAETAPNRRLNSQNGIV